MDFRLRSVKAQEVQTAVQLLFEIYRFVAGFAMSSGVTRDLSYTKSCVGRGEDIKYNCIGL
jgi:hypothetical protein